MRLLQDAQGSSRESWGLNRQQDPQPRSPGGCEGSGCRRHRYRRRAPTYLRVSSAAVVAPTMFCSCCGGAPLCGFVSPMFSVQGASAVRSLRVDFCGREKSLELLLLVLSICFSIFSPRLFIFSQQVVDRVISRHIKKTKGNMSEPGTNQRLIYFHFDLQFSVSILFWTRPHPIRRVIRGKSANLQCSLKPSK